MESLLSIVYINVIFSWPNPSKKLDDIWNRACYTVQKHLQHCDNGQNVNNYACWAGLWNVPVLCIFVQCWVQFCAYSRTVCEITCELLLAVVTVSLTLVFSKMHETYFLDFQGNCMQFTQARSLYFVAFDSCTLPTVFSYWRLI